MTRAADALTAALVTPNEQDASLFLEFLADAGIPASIHHDLSDLGDLRTDALGCLVVVEEAMEGTAAMQFDEAVGAQPAWSDLPIVFIASEHASLMGLRDRLFPHAGNITVVQRPLHPVALLSAIRVALRARARQFEVRDLLAERERVAQEITRRNLRYQFLARLDDLTRPLDDPAEITSGVARMLGAHLGVNRCAYADVEADGDTFNLTGDYNNGVESIVGRYRFVEFGEECLRLMRAGLPYIVADSETDHRTALVRHAYRKARIRAVICVPLLKSGRFAAAMAVHHALPRSWSDDDVSLVQAVASRAWESIERARIARQAEAELRETDRRKDEFLAMLAHELRNPLAPIRNAAQVLTLLADKTGDAGMRQTSEIITRQVTHMTGLVNDLLDVSRVTRGLITLQTEELNVADIIGEAVEQVRSLAEERRHKLDAGAPARELWVRGDRTRLVQVLANLLNNAVKFTPGGGAIGIAVEATDATVAIRVKDNGVGIRPELLPHVFELFIQGQRSPDRSQGGLGVGLALVRSLVALHAGTVSLHSDGEGAGCEVTVTLRRIQAAAQPRRGDAPRNEAGTPQDARVIVVDDNVDAARTLAVLLSEAGYQVAAESNPAQALARAFDEHPSILLLDIGLPELDGYEMARRLRAHAATRDATLIAITGYGSDDDIEKGRRAGFDHYLVKPVEPDHLISLLSSVQSQRMQRMQRLQRMQVS